MDFGTKLEELDLTTDEINRFTKAMKDEKFRDLLREYADEITNPENKKKYEEEIKLLEQQRGMDVKFVHPKPHHVLKTSVNGKEKCFVNVCTNDLMGKPECKAGKGEDGRTGCHWSLPYSLTPGRPDHDSKGGKTTVYDVIFHPDTLHIAEKNPRFMNLVNSTALQALQDAFKVKLDKKNTKILKTKYKGVPNPAVIRTPVLGYSEEDKRSPIDDPLSFPFPDQQKTLPKDTKAASLKDRPKQNSSNQQNSDVSKQPTQPHHTVKYRSVVDLQDYRCSKDSAPSPRPKEIVITIDLPLLKTAADADLDVMERCLVLESQKPAYRLQLPLAYPVDENKGQAKFNKAKKQLTVTLPVLPSKVPPLIQMVDQQVHGKAKVEENGTPYEKKTDGEVELQSFDINSDSSGMCPPAAISDPLAELKNPASELLSHSEGSIFTSGLESIGNEGPPNPRTNSPVAPTDFHTAMTDDSIINPSEEGSLDSCIDSSDATCAASVTPADTKTGYGSCFAQGIVDNPAPYREPTTEPQQEYADLHCSQHSPQQENEASLKHSEPELCDVLKGSGIPAESIPGLSGGICTTAGSRDTTKTVHFSEDVEVASESVAAMAGPALVESKQKHHPNSPQAIFRETNPEDGREVIISDHRTSAAFSFQNTLLYELD